MFHYTPVTRSRCRGRGPPMPPRRILFIIEVTYRWGLAGLENDTSASWAIPSSLHRPMLAPPMSLTSDTTHPPAVSTARMARVTNSFVAGWSNAKRTGIFQGRNRPHARTSCMCPCGPTIWGGMMVYFSVIRFDLQAWYCLRKWNAYT